MPNCMVLVGLAMARANRLPATVPRSVSAESGSGPRPETEAQAASLTSRSSPVKALDLSGVEDSGP